MSHRGISEILKTKSYFSQGLIILLGRKGALKTLTVLSGDFCFREPIPASDITTIENWLK